MATEIIRQSPRIAIKDGTLYEPVFIVINKKIYSVNDWHEALKMLMYTYCFKADKLQLVKKEVGKRDPYLKATLFSDRFIESRHYAKFAPGLTVRVFDEGAENCKLIKKLYKMLGGFELYVLRSDAKTLKAEKRNKLIKSKKQELAENYHYKNGSTKHVIAHVNGKVLNDEEKFYRRTEADFDKATLIGDVIIRPKEEHYLKDYMQYTLKQLLRKNMSIRHEKLFALGMVRAAMKHYAAKTFWPFFGKEYGVEIPGNSQSLINSKFREILKKYNKAYDDEINNYVQNVCMHAFVCDKCADQFFDYMFDFWRIDLSRSIENMTDEDGMNLFNILIEEMRAKYKYGTGLGDVMIHTTMALIKNPRGCRNRFRHILRMIDNSYWNGADYSGSTNRITRLFNEWKNRENGSFQYDLKRTAEGRKAGRGMKLLARPVITFDQATSKFNLLLPKQILRRCTEDEHPVWHIEINGYEEYTEPTLMRGKSSLFTEECSVPMKWNDLFERIEITLKSEIRVYSRRILKEEDFRLFSHSGRNIEITGSEVNNDLSFAFVKNGKTLKCLNAKNPEISRFNKTVNYYKLYVETGDIIILPNQQAVSVGKVMNEGILGSSRQSGVEAFYKGEPYEITADRESIFFKARKNQLNGTSIRIIRNGEEIKFGKLYFEKLSEFRLYDEAEDIYGYAFDLHDYISREGIYDINLSIPGLPVKSYKACYINHFKYSFIDAPYIFEEEGTISFPKYLTFVTDHDWEITGANKILNFSLDEGRENKHENKFVWDRKLHLKFSFGDDEADIIFDLPVVYWRYNLNESWNFRRPDDIFASKLPANIYINGDLNLREAKLILIGKGGVEETEVQAVWNKEKESCYFRTVDFKEYLDRQQFIRQLKLLIDEKKKIMANVVCRSYVIDSNITGDFNKNIIYGNFEIIGISDYMVTVWRDNELIEEDIPVKDGHFELKCDVKEGDYKVVVYEIEDDGSGFGSVSYEIGKYPLRLRDVNSLTGHSLKIVFIQDREGKYKRIHLSDMHIITGLKKLGYHSDIEDKLEIPTYLHKAENTEEMSQFSYYRGKLLRSPDKAYRICEVLVIFDNSENMSEAILFELDGEDVGPLAMNIKSESLIASSGISTRKFNSQLGKTIHLLDDDLYRIHVEVRE